MGQVIALNIIKMKTFNAEREKERNKERDRKKHRERAK